MNQSTPKPMRKTMSANKPFKMRLNVALAFWRAWKPEGPWLVRLPWEAHWNQRAGKSVLPHIQRIGRLHPDHAPRKSAALQRGRPAHRCIQIITNIHLRGPAHTTTDDDSSDIKTSLTLNPRAHIQNDPQIPCRLNISQNNHLSLHDWFPECM